MGWQGQQRERYKQQQAEKARAEQQEAAQQRLSLKSQFEEQQRIAAEQSAVREQQAKEKQRIEKKQQDEASQRIADGLKLLDTQRQERLRLAREKATARKMPQAPQSRRSHGRPSKPNLGLKNKWLFGILIILLILLWDLGATITSLSFLASIILPIITGFGLWVAYLTWYETKYPSKTGGEVSLINVAQDLGKNRKLIIGSIFLLFILIGGSIGFYFFQHQATDTPIPNTTYTGRLVLQDSLTTNDPLNNSKSRPWINFTSQHGFCKFTA